MDRDFISKTSIDIEAPVAKVWESLVNPEIARKYFWVQKLVQTGMSEVQLYLGESLTAINMRKKG